MATVWSAGILLEMPSAVQLATILYSNISHFGCKMAFLFAAADT
jgi:hypothetical protein